MTGFGDLTEEQIAENDFLWSEEDTNSFRRYMGLPDDPEQTSDKRVVIRRKARVTVVGEALAMVCEERDRQKSLPGSEFDLKNSPNDWIAIVAHYTGESCRRGGNRPTEADYRDSLVKAAAVIVAAIEHIPVMASSGHFSKR